MKTKNKCLVILIGWIAIISLSCENKRPSTSDVQNADSLMLTYQLLVDSVDANWAIMIADDDDKHVLMKRLLLEISYTNNYDKARFDELNSLVEKLAEMRYNQQTMSDSDLIDAYDSATWDLTDQIIQFAREHPRYNDFPLMEELIDDINEKNDYVLMHRIHYDNWVKTLNSFKKSNAEKLNGQNSVIEEEPMPLFELSS